MLIVADKDFWEGTAGPYALVGWRSGKRQRMRRSSLSCETQSVCDAVDELEFVLALWHEITADQPIDLRDM